MLHWWNVEFWCTYIFVYLFLVSWWGRQHYLRIYDFSPKNVHQVVSRRAIPWCIWCSESWWVWHLCWLQTRRYISRQCLCLYSGISFAVSLNLHALGTAPSKKRSAFILLDNSKPKHNTWALWDAYRPAERNPCLRNNYHLLWLYGFLSDEGPLLKMLDFAYHVTAVHQPFIIISIFTCFRGTKADESTTSSGFFNAQQEESDKKDLKIPVSSKELNDTG